MRLAPRRIVVTEFPPAILLPRIVILARPYRRMRRGAVIGTFPAFVADAYGFTSRLQLEQQFYAVPPGSLIKPPNISRCLIVKAVPQLYRDDVFPFSKISAHVVFHVKCAFVICRERGRKNVTPYLFSVEVQHIKSQPTDEAFRAPQFGKVNYFSKL